MAEIILSDRHPHVALIDDEDYQYLVQWRWTFKVSSGKYNRNVYACRNTTNGSRERKIKIMLHNVVLERSVGPRPGPGYTAHHKNGVSLDNRRSNLEWLSRSQQIKEAWKTRKKKK